MSHELSSLSSIDTRFYAQGVSAMDSSSGVIRGRPHGGVAVLWKKTLKGCSIVDMHDTRLMCIQVDNGEELIAFVNVYLPVDNSENLDAYIFYLSKINNFIDEYPSPYVAVLGDFNANYRLGFHSSSGKELEHLCTEENLIISDIEFCDNTSFTFYSAAHNTVSWLDHLVCTKSAHRLVKSVDMNLDYLSSDHFPVCVDMSVAALNIRVTDNKTKKVSSKIPWDDLKEKDILKYKALTDKYLSAIKLDHSLLLCDNPNCQDISHTGAIDRMYENIIDALKCSSEDLVQHTGEPQHRSIAGWNDYCSEAHAVARDSFLHWASNNKPRSGPVFESMKASRAIFKQALRQCRGSESRAHADSLAKKLLTKNTKQFWKEIQKLNGKADVPLPSTVGKATGHKDISEMWRNHYQKLLNSNASHPKQQVIRDKLRHCDSFDDPISHLEVAEAIKALKTGKASGMDSLQSEHFKNASLKVCVLLSLCFNGMLLHGHISQRFMDTVIVPIIKDKKGDVTDADNYRPIALTTVTSKLFETVFLTRFRNYLNTCDNQFGFKPAHSTDMCIFVLKQVIDHYISQSSPLFICYVDASKAFDRINFWVLFEKLLDRGLPCIFIRFLMVWYCCQEFVVRWGDIFSVPFNVSNGVRQGGILSPLLFNIYVDDLSHMLNRTQVGCTINGVIYNHLIYADDTVLIAPSARALQTLLNHCDEFSKNCDIIYNSKKTVCMCIKPKFIKGTMEPPMVLANNTLHYVSSHNYLGVTISADSKDNVEIKKQCRNLYARGNSLIKNFKHCSEKVKCHLFRSYCTSIYCAPLWNVYTAESFRRMQVAYNRIFRILLGLENRLSVSHAFIQRGLDPFIVIIRKSISNLKLRLIASSNNLVTNIVNSLHFVFCALLKKWDNIMY